MKSSKSTPAHASASTSGTRRSQPLRTTRNNPLRVTATGTRSYASKTSLSTVTAEAPIEIFPAITHFADTISALPKEIVRHFTLLKEVDAKIFLPEEELTKLVNEALNAPLPPRPQLGESHHGKASHSQDTISTVDANTVWGPSNMSRRQLFNKCALTMQGMLVSLDEKNHVISTAGDALAKQLIRIDDCLPYIELEISEEARNGSTTHWAYPENRASKANNIGNMRREPSGNQLPTGAQNLADETAARSDARKQTLLEKRKSKNQHIDSDFDDQPEPRYKDKKQGPKVRKHADVHAAIAVGTSNGNTPNGNTSKRRKMEKGTALVSATDRSTVSNPNTNGTASKGKPASPKSTPQPEGSRKRLRTTQTASNGPANKKRNNTALSCAKSPLLGSSPVQIDFLASQSVKKLSSPPINSRPLSARCRQNSHQSNQDKSSLSPSQSKLNSNLSSNSSANTTSNARNLPETKFHSKESNKASKGEHSSEITGQRESKLVNGVPADKGELSTKQSSTKRELLEEKGGVPSAPLTTTIVTTKSGRASKTCTPATASFPEIPRLRASRTPLETPNGKRSHKKNAGLAAQQLAIHNTDVENVEKKGDEDDADIDVNEPRYCYCNNVSYGEMVGCDSQGCKREWFHLACVGLKTAPKGNTKWYCEDCKETTKGKRLGSTR
ncbi:hypothetical protein K3495_g3893 [Podosphaera aphanis]|nr:hypothetical protein K3495_g3893 [Podosphaera aphanis]